MTEKVREEWILPVLEDVRNFLRDAGQTDFSDDLNKLIQTHAHKLKSEGEAHGRTDTHNIVELRARRPHRMD